VLSEADLAKVRDAVQTAERRTRGEIVPMIVPASARYRETQHLAGLLLALVVLAGILTIEYGWGPSEWPATHPAWIILSVAAAYLTGHFLGTFPWCVRLLTSRERMATKVRRRAEWAFYEHGLHRTKEATGILIMLSLLERRAQILADRAIDQRVPPDTWDALVKDLLDGIRQRGVTVALCAAIAACGDLLARHFPARQGNNPNELPDDTIQAPPP
jgi:putative membrane protein